MNHLQLFADTFGWARDVTAPSRRRLGWVYGFEGKCLKEGLRNGAEASIRFGFAHRLRREPVCRRGRPRLLANSVRRRGRFGALSGVWPDSVSPDSKSPRRIFRRGLNSCDDENMPVICPTCQNVFAGSLKRPDHATLHGVVFDIFVERPIHSSGTMLSRSDSGQAARSS